MQAVKDDSPSLPPASSEPKRMLKHWSSTDLFEDLLHNSEEEKKNDPPYIPSDEDFMRGNAYLVCKGLCVIDVVKEAALRNRIPSDGSQRIAFDRWDAKEGWKWQKWPSTPSSLR
jgi:hypothetical protein